MLIAMSTSNFYLITVYTPTFCRNVLHLPELDSLVITLSTGVSKLSMAARYGRIVRPHRPAPAAFWLHHIGATDRLSRAVMADRLRLLPEAARRAALAVVPLRQL